jgi:hypothetical protein
MSQTEWSRLCAVLAGELRTACAETLTVTDLNVEDRTDTMLAEEEDPRVVPYWPIGLLHRFRLRERRVHRVFGRHWLPISYWKSIVRFGLEEMFDAPSWSYSQGMWCVADERHVPAVRPIIERFSVTNRIKFEFSSRPE